MGTIADKLAYTKKAKVDIKQSINDKGVIVTDTDPLGVYFEKINEITGGGGGSSAPVVSLYDYNAVEGSSITELTCNCNTYKEGKVIAAVITRYDLIEVPVGWTVIYTTKGFENGENFIQRLTLLEKDSIENTTLITVKCTTAQRIYITMLSFYNIFNIKITSPEKIVSGVGTCQIPQQVDNKKTKLWFLHKITWPATDNYQWTTNDKNIQLVQAILQPRLCAVLDSYHENRIIDIIDSNSTDNCEILGITLEVKNTGGIFSEEDLFNYNTYKKTQWNDKTTTEFDLCTIRSDLNALYITPKEDCIMQVILEGTASYFSQAFVNGPFTIIKKIADNFKPNNNKVDINYGIKVEKGKEFNIQMHGQSYGYYINVVKMWKIP